jgi:hypothetical protein
MEKYLQKINQSFAHLNKAFWTHSSYFHSQVDASRIQKHDLGFEPEWVVSFTETGKTA